MPKRCRWFGHRVRESACVYRDDIVTWRAYYCKRCHIRLYWSKS